MKKPLILVTPNVDRVERVPLAENNIRLGGAYLDALNRAGAVPVVASECDFAALVERADGVLFSGGVDVDPALYGETVWNDTVNVSHDRDTLELALFRAAYQRRLPMLGICRGIQLINVALGGTLWQDIPSQCPDSLIHAGGVRHTVETAADSRMRRLLGKRFKTNSFHHQALKTLGRGLIVTAWASDGTVEAVEHTALPIFAAQWHPERMSGTVRPRELPPMDAIFGEFTRLCAERTEA